MKRTLQLKEIKIHALIGVGVGDGSDLNCNYQLCRQTRVGCVTLTITQVKSLLIANKRSKWISVN